MSLSAVSNSSTQAQLVKLTSGEYTAASVTADPKDATKLYLVKEQDGNYGTTVPQPAAEPSAKSSASVLLSLTSLTLGGA